MAYRKPRVPPQFADLISTLAQSKNVDSALYQVVQEIINRLAQFNFEPEITNIITGGGGGGGDATKFATYHTKNDETAALPNSVQLLAGTNIVFDDTVPNKRTISSSGGGGTLIPHAPTHQPGGTDPMAVDAIPVTGSLRTLGSGPNQAAPGNDPRFTAAPQLHAPTHSDGGTDPVDVKNLAGYPGGTTTFLRADKTFATPPGGAGGGMNLDYLGDYVAGPVYNDGDIVVGPDNIAYMCVVDGTTTPPEPWPGIGVATADATFWTVNNHPGLSNERALSSLANGYVRSTAGEPSTVATIPLTDTTGILPDNRLTSNVALKNIDNYFVAQTIGSYSVILGANSALYFNDPNSPVDSQVWRFVSYSNGFLYLAALNNSGSITQGQIAFSRDGGVHGIGTGLTALNASNLTSGLVATPRLGSGTANSSTYLRGDSTWAVPSGVPSGAVLMFNAAACPPGYTRIAAWDGYYVRMGPVVTSGGANSHTHPVGSYTVPAHTHSAGSLTVDSHNHGTVSISGSAASGGGHSHGYSGTVSGTTGSSGSQMNVDAGASGNMSRGDHTHSFGANYSEETNTVSGHTHSVSGSGSTGNASPGVTGNTGSTGSNVAVTGTSGTANNMPLYVDMLACMKD